MLPGFEQLVEQRIQKALKKGDFDNLEGLHKPLKFTDDNVPEELRLAHKILKNAGFKPPEVELKKKIRNTQDLLAGTDTGSKDKLRLQKKLNYYLMKLESSRSTSRPCLSLTTEMYRKQLLNKLS